VITRRELHALPIYREFYARLGIEHQMAFTLPSQSQRILAIALSRRHEDFSDSERDLVERARPFLIQAYQNAITHELVRSGVHTNPDAMLQRLRGVGLTTREAEVLRMVALGRSNQDAGAALEITERTVAKHLQRSFAKLGVPNRSHAATRVWELAGRPSRDDWGG
jgi:DNA-binding CsgD family transcriptional regulator